MSKVISSLVNALPDERPVLSLQIVESVVKCPAGYWPVSRTYDEDADAGLLKQSGIFGKKSSHYICLSKSEGVPGYVMDGVLVIGEREAAPAGFSVAGRAGKRRLCTRVSRQAAPAAPPRVTDVIVCSRMRRAPDGFHLAGEVNGKVVCYKVSGGHPSPTHLPSDYENVVSHTTPEANRKARAVPERPPRLLINELNHLNLKTSPLPYPDSPPHEYEALSPAYSVTPRPARPAPHPPARAAAPAPRDIYHTLDGYNAMDGVPFALNPMLSSDTISSLLQFPNIKKRTKLELDREYSYPFTAERNA